MTQERGDPPSRPYASSPCMAHEVADGSLIPDPLQAVDVARWRRAERIRLRGWRDALSVGARQAMGARLCLHLDAFLAARFGGLAGSVLSAYWPIKGEPDLRPLMRKLHAAGVLVALPVVEVKAAPLVFRRWTPDMRMERGDWNIPVPPADAPVVTPAITLAPLVGWDRAGYRLGYGGGYFDRTLAALSPRPFSIGVGFQASELPTIFPQPHDMPLQAIVTDEGVQDIHPDGQGAR